MRNFWRQLWLYLQKNRRQFLTLFLIALVVRGAIFFTHIPFSQDQVRDVLVIKEHLSKFDFYIPLGPAAASYSNFNVLPFYYYLQLIAHLLFGNAFYSMNIFIILMESCTTIMIYYFLSRTGLNNKVSFLGSLLYACAPNVAFLATSAWNPNLVPFFTIALLISGLWYLLDDREYGLIISILSVVFLTGLHFQWFVLLPFIATIAIKACWKIKKSWKSLLLAILFSLLLLSPYLYSELSNNFQNFNGSLEFLVHGPVVFERISKPVYLFFFFPNYYNRLFFDDAFVHNWSWLYENYTGIELGLLLNSLCFWGIFAFNIWLVYKNREKCSGKWLGATLLIFVSMAILLRFYKGDKPDYFLNVFIPFIFVWLMQVIAYIRDQKIQIGIVGLIILVGNFIFFRQPWYNQYHDYKTIVQKIENTNSQREIIILNQELEKPIRYFLNDDNFVATPSGNIENTIFICYTRQFCGSYEPNEISSENNIFTYDLVTPVNYGIVFDNVDFSKSESWHTPALEGYLVVNEATPPAIVRKELF